MRTYPAFVPHLGMLFVNVGFSLWNVLGKVVFDSGVDQIIFAFYREAGTSILFLLSLKLCFSDITIPVVTRKDLVLFCFSGVMGIYSVQLFYILGLEHTTAAVAGHPIISYVTNLTTLREIDPLAIIL